jgi:hypothetical protein
VLRRHEAACAKVPECYSAATLSGCPLSRRLEVRFPWLAARQRCSAKREDSDLKETPHLVFKSPRRRVPPPARCEPAHQAYGDDLGLRRAGLRFLPRYELRPVHNPALDGRNLPAQCRTANCVELTTGDWIYGGVFWLVADHRRSIPYVPRFRPTSRKTCLSRKNLPKRLPSSRVAHRRKRIRAGRPACYVGAGHQTSEWRIGRAVHSVPT